MKRFKITSLHITNTLPFQVSPHLTQRVWSDNPYLPAHLRSVPRDKEVTRELVKDTPKAAWRNGVPVIPSTSFKGTLRHLLADYQTRGLSNVSVLMFNYLALGGIKQKGKAAIANSPNNRQKEREKFPLVSLFGASTPVFLNGRIRTFPDLVPTSRFELDEIPIIRTDPLVRDAATARCNQQEIDDAISVQSSSSGAVKAAEKKRDAAIKAHRAADDATTQAALNDARRELEVAEQESMVQTGQLHSFFVIPAGQTFSHEFRIAAEDHELGLLLIGMREFAIEGGLLGGQVSRGAGAGLDFSYEISVEESGAWVPLGVINNEDIDDALTPFVEAYERDIDVWTSNIV